MSITKITLQPETIEKLRERFDDESLPEIKGFEGWVLEANTERGDYDPEKGAMYNYLLTLISPEGNQYTGRGGYYTGPTGELYNYAIEFIPKKTNQNKDKKEYKLYLKLKAKYEDE